MAQTIKIKRSTGSAAPSTLAQGELAYSKGSDTFYVGDPASANTPIAVGGAIKNNAGTPVLATGVTAAEIRTLIDVDQSGTDNSTNVSLSGAYDYLTLSGQAITLNQIDLTTDVTGTLPIGNGGTGATTASAARTALGVAIGSDVLAYDANLQSFVSTFTLPTTDGSNGQVLITNGAGTLSFSTVSVTDTDVSVANLQTRLGEISTATTMGTGASADFTFASDVVITGNLTINGTTTTVNSETLTVDDNIIVLNNNVTGTPTENSGIEIERGTSANVQFRWNETNDNWEFTKDGSAYQNLLDITASTPTATTVTTLENLPNGLSLNTKGNGNGYFVGPNSTENTGFATSYSLFGAASLSTPYYGGLSYVSAAKTMVSGRNGAGLAISGASAGLNSGVSAFVVHNTSSTPVLKVAYSNGAMTINNAFTLPTADGTSGQVLQTNGAGAVTWSDVGDITSVQISSTDGSISGVGTGSTGAISFDLEVATIDGGTY